MQNRLMQIVEDAQTKKDKDAEKTKAKLETAGLESALVRVQR